MLRNIISNRILLFAILLISLFGMNLQEGKADCGFGYNDEVWLVTVNGCNYTVEVCYKCSPAALIAIDVKPITKFTPIPPCNQTWSESQVLAAITLEVGNRVLVNASKNCEIKPCGVNPPAEFTFGTYA